MSSPVCCYPRGSEQIQTQFSLGAALLPYTEWGSQGRSLLQARDPSLRGHEWLRDSAGQQGTWQTAADDVTDGFRDTTTTNSNTVALY